MSHESLANLYYTNFVMMQYHQYSLFELESMIPFERDIYVNMLLQHLKEKADKEKR